VNAAIDPLPDFQVEAFPCPIQEDALTSVESAAGHQVGMHIVKPLGGPGGNIVAELLLI